MTMVARIDCRERNAAASLLVRPRARGARESTNVYVRLTLDDGTVGYGEGVPRE